MCPVFIKYPPGSVPFDQDEDNKQYKKIWAIGCVFCFCDYFFCFPDLFTYLIPVSIEFTSCCHTEVCTSCYLWYILEEWLIDITSEWISVLIFEDDALLRVWINIREYLISSSSYSNCKYSYTQSCSLTCCYKRIDTHIGSTICYEYDGTLVRHTRECRVSNKESISYRSTRESWKFLSYRCWADTRYHRTDTTRITGKWKRYNWLPSKHYHSEEIIFPVSEECIDRLFCWFDTTRWDIFSKHGTRYIEDDEDIMLLSFEIFSGVVLPYSHDDTYERYDDPKTDNP